jgi:hypothetical protein
MQKLLARCAHGLTTAVLLVTIPARADGPSVEDIPPPPKDTAPASRAADKPAPRAAAVTTYAPTAGPRFPDSSIIEPDRVPPFLGAPPLAPLPDLAPEGVPQSPLVPGTLAPAPEVPETAWWPYAAPGRQLPLRPWRGVFFENDFGFLDDPNAEYVVGEELKNMDLRSLTIGKMYLPDLKCDDPGNVEIREYLPLARLPNPTRISYGGELRFREMDEANRLRPGGPARGDYQLWRWRQYLNLEIDDWLRVYAEGIDASMDNNPLPITGIDVNRWDLQNLFLDVRLWNFDGFDDRPLWFRVGRQELLYGSQRLISPYDWANTRRNFEGLKIFTRGSDWDFDLWFTRPVNTATIGDGPISHFVDHFDSPNMAHTFSGAWFTYKAFEYQVFDLYWLWDWNAQFIQPNFAGGNRHTIGGRWLGHDPVPGSSMGRTWHGEVEGGYQFGNDFGKDVRAGFVVAGLGHSWDEAPWRPDVWVYYNWASGSNNLNGRTTNTFSQQYGDLHSYLGLIDNIARQNIIDINTRASVRPLPKLAFQTQHHFFFLANSHDVLYTVTGEPFGKPNTGSNVGDEFDLLATYTFNPNFNLQVGYSWFWYGAFVENNSPRGTAEQLYIQTTMRY